MSILSTGEGKAAARLQRRPEADSAVHPTADLVATADRRALPCSLGFSLEPLDGGAGALDLGSRSPSPTFELPALEFLGPGSGQVAHSGATLGARPSHPDQISPRPGAAEQSDERGEVGSVPRGSGDQPATEERTAPSSSAAPPHEGPAAGARAAADGGVNKPPELAPLLRVAAPGGRLQAEEERRRGWMARWLRPSLVVRILLAAAVVAFAVQYAASRVLLHASVDGVVNAPLVALRAPIEGQVDVGALVRPGGTVQSGEVLFTITDDRQDQRNSADLKARAASVEGAVQEVDRKIATLTVQQNGLRERAQAHQEAAVRRLTAMLGEASAGLEGARAKAGTAQNEWARGQDLATRGFVSRARLDDIEGEVRRTRSEVDRLRASVDRYQAELGAARGGVFIGDGYSDVPYSQQRIEEINLRLADLRAERAGATRTQRELAERLAVEEQRLQRLGRDAVHSPAVGLVWNLAVADGARVARGDTLAEIAQCGRSFVEATLPERGFDVVRPGDAVRVRLSSGTGDIPGMVRSVRGAGAIGASGRAAGVERGGTGMMWVVVDIDAAALSKQPAGDCQIGRTAKVLF
jgi:multidrug resistance efflux pump